MILLFKATWTRPIFFVSQHNVVLFSGVWAWESEWRTYMGPAAYGWYLWNRHSHRLTGFSGSHPVHVSGAVFLSLFISFFHYYSGIVAHAISVFSFLLLLSHSFACMYFPPNYSFCLFTLIFSYAFSQSHLSHTPFPALLSHQDTCASSPPFYVSSNSTLSHLSARLGALSPQL